MSLRRHVCRLPVRVKSRDDYVWISEDVLDSAISHFSRGRISRRHIGLAPGPLEARKRAAKRRMMNLTGVGGGVAGELDPTLLQGLGQAPEQENWRWQSPTAPAPKDAKGTAYTYAEPSSWLPRWLKAPNSHKEDKLQSEEKEGEGSNQVLMPDGKQAYLQGEEKNEPVSLLLDPSTLHEELPISKPPPAPVFVNEKQGHQIADRERVRADPKFLSDMRMSRNLGELHTWATNYGVDLRSYSRLAFRHLVALGSPLAVLLEALEDAALRTTGNLFRLLECKVQQHLSQSDAGLLGDWIKVKASLGMLSEDEISKFVRLLHQTSRQAVGKQWTCTLGGSLIDGLQSSTVINLKDLDPKALRLLLDSVSQDIPTSRSLDIGIRLIKALQPSQAEQMEPSIIFFVRRLVGAKAAIDVHDRQAILHLEAIPQAVEILQSLPRTFAHSVIVGTSKALIHSRIGQIGSGIAMIKLLELWWSALARSGLVDFTYENATKIQIERLLSQTRTGKLRSDPALEIIAPYLRHLSKCNKARFMLQYCFEPDMSELRIAQVMDRFAERRRGRATESPLVSMMRVAQDEFQLTQLKTARVFRLLQMLHMSETIVDVISSTKETNIAIGESAVLHTIRTHMNVYPEIAQRIFCACPQLSLEKCPDFAETLIANPRIHPKWPLIYYKSRHPGPGVPSCREPLPVIRTRARLLGRMALAYAADKNIPHRVALRKVYECYEAHMSEGLGRLGVNMVLAFTAAGLIRPLQQGQWVSTVKLRWILSLIRSVESPEVAAQVDLLIYQWRGRVIRQIRTRLLQNRSRTSFLRERPLDFQIKTKWSEQWSRYTKVLTPLNTIARLRLDETIK